MEPIHTVTPGYARVFVLWVREFGRRLMWAA